MIKLKGAYALEIRPRKAVSNLQKKAKITTITRKNDLPRRQTLTRDHIGVIQQRNCYETE